VNDPVEPTHPASEADDVALLDELRLAVAAVDPLPPRLLETARAAYAWRTVDEDLARLQFDSLASSEVLVRSTGVQGVHLSFATDQASIEVQVVGGSIVGQVAPAGAVDISLLLGSGRRIGTVCDDLGQFTFDPKPSGPIRLVVHLAAGEVVTEWFTA
jgi:hypothetical protein